VAVRAEITPSSGARTAVCARRSCSACILARAAFKRARAVFSAVRYWLILCALRKPVAWNWRARSPLLWPRPASPPPRQPKPWTPPARRPRCHWKCVPAPALLHPVTHVDPHLGQTEIADFGADHRLLPGGDIAIGRQQPRPLDPLRRNGHDRQRRLGTAAVAAWSATTALLPSPASLNPESRPRWSLPRAPAQFPGLNVWFQEKDGGRGMSSASLDVGLVILLEGAQPHPIEPCRRRPVQNKIRSSPAVYMQT